MQVRLRYRDRKNVHVRELASGRWMNQEKVGQKQMEKMLCKSLSWKTGN
jgi:hypothetical protein